MQDYTIEKNANMTSLDLYAMLPVKRFRLGRA
jgi:hypothetical protein